MMNPKPLKRAPRSPFISIDPGKLPRSRLLARAVRGVTSELPVIQT